MENDSKMIITKTPLRITLGGGGTDMPEYYEKRGGQWANVTIDKYVYVAVKHRFEKQMRLAYSKLEYKNLARDVEHPIIREVLKMCSINNHFELNTFSDVIGGSGLGSSGAFTVGLLNAIHNYHKETVDKETLAELAYIIERKKLKRVLGKQDQYSAVYGGARLYRADEDGNVSHCSITLSSLEKHILMFYTQKSRSSHDILTSVSKDIETLKKIEHIGNLSINSLLDDDIITYGELMDEHWKLKRTMSPHMSDERIDNFYLNAKHLGSYGGKLVGAGGGGYMLLIAPPCYHNDIINSAYNYNFVYTPVKFTYTGTGVIEW